MACTGRNLEFGRATVALAAEGKKEPRDVCATFPSASAPIIAGSVVTGSFVAARRHHALPSPQDISATSLLTILGTVEAVSYTHLTLPTILLV